MQTPSWAQSGGPQKLVIGVDHDDAANQQPFPQGRVFEYTDFFSRQVSAHAGDTLNFRAAPFSFHIVGLAKSEAVARSVYPVAFADKDGGQDTATGSGSAKIVIGLSNFPITGGSTSGGGSIDFTRPGGPPVCGDSDLGQPPCRFKGGNDIEVAGPNPGLTFDPTTLQPVIDPTTHQPIPKPVDWNITLDPATPLGAYQYFCFIHPGMRGKLKVVEPEDATTTQAQIDHRSAEQFKSDRRDAIDAEADANVIRSTGDPGERTYTVHMGVSAADNHVAIDEILPNKPLSLQQGDRVKYLWRDPHNVHSVKFPGDSNSDPPPFGVFDCGATVSPAFPPCLEPGDTQPEALADPGTSPPGTVLKAPADLVDSGVLAGTGYGIHPSVQTWSIRTDQTSQTATYTYHCTVHDFMQGTIKLTAGSGGDNGDDHNGGDKHSGA
jgi:plastocyanin